METEPNWETSKILLPLISESRRQRIERMPSVSNKLLSLSAELLLRQIAVKRLGVANEELILSTTSSGKPCLMHHEDFFFN